MMILIPILVIIAVFLWFALRNNAIYKFRIGLINEIFRLQRKENHEVYSARIGGDSTAEYPSDWRWEELNTIPYNAMFWPPWKALPSFYREGFPESED